MDSSPWPGPLAAVTAPIHLAHASPAPAVYPFTGRDWALLIALLVVLVIAGLASASETALTSVNRIRIRNLAESGDTRAQLIERMLRDPNTFLSTILVVNNLAVIIASTLATLIALDVFASFGEIISTILLSFVVLVACEITPKTAAVQAPERWARRLVVLVHWTTIALRPIVAGLTYITNGLVRLIGGKPRVRGPFVTEEELRLLVEVGEEEGVLEEEEKEMIHNVFELADTTAREVMVPRIDMVTIEADAHVEEALHLIVQGGQSRIPVYSESIDNIIGVLYAKDLLRVLAGNQTPPESVRSLVRPAYFVPETKRLDDLLHELQQQRVHMAIVVDEYSGVAGLVTIEDVVEEIIGDIQDEYDREEVLYEQVSPDEYIVDAKISIDDFNDLMDAKLTSEDYDTLGGLIYVQLDKIPSVGDTVQSQDLTFTVLGTKGRRVTKVRVVRKRSTLAQLTGEAGSPPAGAPREAPRDASAAAPTPEPSAPAPSGQPTAEPSPPALPPSETPPALPPPEKPAPDPSPTGASPSAPTAGPGDSAPPILLPPAGASNGISQSDAPSAGVSPQASATPADIPASRADDPAGGGPPAPGSAAPDDPSTPPRGHANTPKSLTARGSHQRNGYNRHPHGRGPSQARRR